jgi:hypothetical protein
MSLTEGSSTRRRLALAVGLTALMATTGYTQEALVKDVGDTLTEVNVIKAQLAATASSLNALLAVKPGEDLRPAYQAYSDDVDKTKQAAATTKERGTRMDADAASYFSTWKADNDRISNAELKKAATKRLGQVQNDYSSSVASLRAAGSEFGPFLADLGDIHTVLSNDLTASGLKGAEGVIKKAKRGHAEVQKQIDAAVKHLTATQKALSPVAAAK